MKRRDLWTGASFLTLDEAQPRAEALVAEGETIAFVGPLAEAEAFAGPGARRHRLSGGTVVPGFNDNHVHAVLLGDHLLAPNLGGLSREAIVALLKATFPDPAPGQVIYAFNWDYPACPEPRKEVLDEAFPRTVVVLSQFSGHAQWMNSRALEELGIRKGGPDPTRGQVLRDPDGEPTGIVRDLGETFIMKKRFRRAFYDRRERDLRLDLAFKTFSRVGVTSLQDNTWFYPELFSLARGRRRGTLPLRFSTWPLGRQAWTVPAMDLVGYLGGYDRDWVRRGPVKYFLDGAFSTRTACLCEPYADDPQGGLCEDPESPRATLEHLARHRRQGAFHIIGDRGIALFLDAFEEAVRGYPVLRDLRIRIEHAQLIRHEDILRIKALGILVAAQPSALADPGKDERLLGRERALRAYPYRSLLDAGVPLSFGSDIPGESTCDPLLSLHWAVNREGGEAISPLEALACYTAGSAYAEFQEARKGRLKAGMLADFTELSDDPTAVAPGTLKDLRVTLTVTGGRETYRAAR